MECIGCGFLPFHYWIPGVLQSWNRLSKSKEVLWKRSCWGKSSRRCECWFDSWAWPGQLEVSPLTPSPLFLECASTCVPHSQKLPQRYSRERLTWYWDFLNWIHDSTQLKPLYKHVRFRGQVQRSTCLSAAQDKPRKFPSILYLPPINLKWSAFFSGLSPPSGNRPLQTTPGKLPRRLPPNRIADFYEPGKGTTKYNGICVLAHKNYDSFLQH